MRVRAAAGEFIGTAGLSLAVMGGIHSAATLGSSPAASIVGVAAIAAAVAVILAALGPLTGGHINPAISLSLALSRHVSVRRFAGYAVAQCAGALFGGVLANWLWSVDLVSLGGGGVEWQTCVMEGLATFGLIAIIHGCIRGGNAAQLWIVVPGYVVVVGLAAPFWVINPAVVIAVAIAGGAWSAVGVTALVASEFLGAAAAALLVNWLYQPQQQPEAPAVVPVTQGSALFEVLFDAPHGRRAEVAQTVLHVVERIHRPIDFSVIDPAGRLLLAVDANEEQVAKSLERRLSEHVTLALVAAGMPSVPVRLRAVERDQLVGANGSR